MRIDRDGFGLVRGAPLLAWPHPNFDMAPGVGRTTHGTTSNGHCAPKRRASQRETCRDAPLMTQVAAVEATGDYDYQQMLKIIDLRATEEYAMDDGASMAPSALHHWLTRILYQRRSKMDPLWNRRATPSDKAR